MDTRDRTGGSGDRRPLLELHGAVLLFGAAGLFGKLVTVGSAPLTLARSAIAAAFVLVVARALGISLRPRNAGDLRVFAVSGAMLALHWTAFFRAIEVSTVSIGVITAATFPVFTALLAPLAARRWPDTFAIALAGVALGGVSIMVGSFELSDAPTQGVLWGLLAAALFAILTLINETMIVGYSAQVVAFYQYAIAAAVLVPFVASDLGAATSTDLLYLLALGTVFTGVAHTLFITSMQSIPATVASLAVSLEPVYGVGLAWLLLGEELAPRFVAGAILILAAVVAGSVHRTRFSASGRFLRPFPTEGPSPSA